MKRLIALCLLLAVFLTACGSPGSHEVLNPKEPVIVTVWSYYNSKQKEILDDFVVRFNDDVGAEKGVIVEHISYGDVTELSKALIAAAREEGGAERMPDIFILYKGVAREVEKVRPLMNLLEEFKPEELEQFVDVFVQTGKYTSQDEAMKMFPIGKSTEFLMINDTSFQQYVEAGVVDYTDLTTYEGLVEAARRYYEFTDAMTPQPNDGKALYGMDSVENYVFVSLAEMGKDLVRFVDGKEVVALDKEAMKRLWDHYYVPFVKGYFGHRAKFISEDIKSGFVLLSQGSSSSSNFFPKTVINETGQEIRIQAKILPIPHFEGADSKCLVQGGGLFVSKSTPQREKGAIEFIKWMTGSEINTEFAAKCSYLPVRKDNFSKESVEQAAERGEIKEITKKAMLAAIERLSTETPYEPDPTEHYEQIRRLMSVYFRQRPADDRMLVEERLKSGFAYEDAIADIISEEKFNSWFSQMEQDIEDILKR